ncbi:MULTISPECIES: hypothetical protein [Streptomyces]|uniref:DUF1453 domain-containing protein n=2 Tax=Streptomyces rimosus subsp. rimosus TaxID=132474 RepID=L8ES84_STRR1|nr:MULTISPECIES: hypothetical protein [Streptomyces]KOG67958.1 membrane protein [Kitasatospora aureofaciens]MYT42832.1 DUF1453 domain-containing protein [Streptomyces sp. SID5471]KEF02999.1 membrane protein [Streptomyces rimosus]KEF18041.1 membrane protein [Streptomyces rimosus]KOT26214.1 membrane protein [Streptomyces sp. NRRL WC-3701]
MSGSLNVLVIVAVIAVVVVRQLKPQRLETDGRRWWLLPGILAIMAVREPGLLDKAHPAGSVVLLAVGVVLGLLTGAAWAWTMRIWTDDDGAVWSAGRPVTAVAWVLGAALRFGLYGVAVLAGIHLGSQSTMLTVAATLLARTGTMYWRAQTLRPTYRVAAGG